MTGTVTVACKHPHGLHLDLFDNNGGRRRVTIRGNAVGVGASGVEMAGGYALTEVESDHWQAWAAANKDSPLLKERIVFAQAKAASAVSQAQEQASVPAIAPAVQPNAVPGIEPAKAE